MNGQQNIKKNSKVSVLIQRFLERIPVIGMLMYKVIHKSLRDFRHLRYSNRGGHAEGEHVNRGRDTPYFCPNLTGARYVHPW